METKTKATTKANLVLHNSFQSQCIVIALCERPKYHSRSKHVATQYCFIQSKIYVTNKFS